jgi:hypothetical protein
MPTSPVQEFLNRGLVNVRDPSLLTPGELQQSDNCVYRPFDPAIHAAPGRKAVHPTPFTGAIKGLAWLSADGATDRLIAYNGTKLFLMPFDATAFTSPPTTVWTEIQGIGTLRNDGDEQMTVIKYDTAYYILNGVNNPRCVRFVTPPGKTVTTCTISGTTVTSTEAKIFTDIVIGQTVTGTNVFAGTVISGKTYTIVAGVYTVTSLTLSKAGTNGSGLTLIFTTDPFVTGDVMGMIPTGPMENAVTVGAGAWPDSGEFGGKGFYWIFYTEAVIPSYPDDYSGGFLESACTVKDIDLRRFEINSPTTQAITVKRNNNLWNDGSSEKPMATHWFIYMSPVSPDPLKIPVRSRFVRLGGPIPISETSRSISTTATSSGWLLPTEYADVPGFTPVEGPGGMLNLGGTATYFPNDHSAMYLKTFKISTSVLEVTGVEVEVTMTSSGVGKDGGVGVYLEHLNGAGVIQKRSRACTAKVYTSKWATLRFGSVFDGLDPTPSAWVGSDFFDDTNGSFRIFIHCFWYTAIVDCVRVNVHYNGFPPGVLGAAYRTVAYRSQVGVSIVDSAALPPPAGSSTGDVFHGQIVLNSCTARNAIIYSQTGFPASFPQPYVMTFDSPKKDIVTCIKRTGNILVVGLQDSIKRVNYLPTELDTDNQGGLAYEPIASDHGICGRHAAAVVDLPGLGTVLVYASYKGIHYTAGARSEFLNVDLDWRKTVNITALSTAEIAVYPAMNWIVLLYCPYGASHTRNTRMLIFDYSPDKLKQSPSGVTLPAIGPITVSGRSVTAATLSGVDYLLTGHEADGFVYAEDQGHSLPTGYYTQEIADPATHTVVKNTSVIRTRLFYAAGLDRDTRVERTYLRYDNDGTTTAVSACALTNPNGIGTITKANAFAATYTTLPGQMVSGIGIRPGTIVVSATASVVTLSHTVDTVGTADIVFDTGTLEIAVRVQGMRDSLATVESGYISTHEGNLNNIHLDDMGQAFELQIRKVALPNGSLVDLATAMRLHYFTTLISETGMETGRPV